VARLLPAARRYAVTGFLHDPVVDLLVDVNEPIAQPCERAHPLGEIGLDHRLFLGCGTRATDFGAPALSEKRTCLRNLEQVFSLAP
jgi:hypothetical protein